MSGKYMAVQEQHFLSAVRVETGGTDLGEALDRPGRELNGKEGANSLRKEFGNFLT